MPLQKYLELDSTYRNRNADPNPAQFSVTVSQSGLRSQLNAIDPVSRAYPEIIFVPDQYNVAGLNYVGDFTLLYPSSTPTTLYLQYAITFNPALSTVKNFYVGANLVYNTGGLSPTNLFRRISEWTWIHSDALNQYFIAVIDSPFSSYDPTASPTFKIYVTNNNAITYFLPASLSIPNYYSSTNGYIIQNITYTFSASPIQPVWTTITDFDSDSHYASIVPFALASNSDTFVIRRELPIYTNILNKNSKNTLSVFVEGTSLFQNLTPNTLINSFIQFYKLNNSAANVNRKIVAVQGTSVSGSTIIVYSGDGSSITVTDDNGVSVTYIFDTLILADPLPSSAKANDQFEILQFSYDNYSPFVYSGTLSSNSQPVAYEMTLNSLTLPNQYLTNGGRIAYYPFVYVVIENISTTQGNAKNIIYSNNPHTYKAIFKVPITDLNHPKNTPFVR